MNAKQAKQIPLGDLLESLGYHTAQVKKKELWYYSPFRKENTPSFKIDITKNVWYDHGEGVGGNIIDFVFHYKQIQNVREVLAWLRQNYHSSPSLSLPFKKDKEAESIPLLELVEGSIKTPEHPHLLSYTKERGISESIAKFVFKELRFINHVKGKTYYALALENRSDGFDLRNKYFKGAISPKDFTFKGQGSKTIIIFEGMFDYASYLSMNGVHQSDILILNSLSFHQPAAKLIQEREYSRVISFFDNDKAGQSVQEKYTDWFGAKHNPQNHIYEGFEDLNAFLIEKGEQDSSLGLSIHP